MSIGELSRWLRVTNMKGYIRGGSLMIKKKDLEDLQKPGALPKDKAMTLFALTGVDGLVTVED